MDMFFLMMMILILSWLVYLLYLTNDAKKICDRMLVRFKKMKKDLKDYE